MAEHYINNCSGRELKPWVDSPPWTHGAIVDWIGITIGGTKAMIYGRVNTLKDLLH